MDALDNPLNWYLLLIIILNFELYEFPKSTKKYIVLDVFSLIEYNFVIILNGIYLYFPIHKYD